MRNGIAAGFGADATGASQGIGTGSGSAGSDFAFGSAAPIVLPSLSRAPSPSSW